MSDSTQISAVIPVHNRAGLLERLLRTLGEQTTPVAEIIVVDNNSTDNARDIARSFGCRVIEFRENVGFARAVNAGWRASSGSWVAILNSDVELEKRWLELLMLHTAGASFVTGTILSMKDQSSLDGTYDLVSRAGCAWRAGHGHKNPEERGIPRRIATAPATACLYRRDVLEQLNGFDEVFESYLEDVDLGLRCLRAGLWGVYVPDAIARHAGSATFGRWDPRVVRLISRNQLVLIARHYDRALFRSCFWPIVAGQLLWGLVALRHAAFGAWLRGKWEGLKAFRLQGEPSQALREFLGASEREIRLRAHDSYWRWYFRLTPPAAL